MNPFISKTFKLPVTRKKILKRAKKKYSYCESAGVCIAIEKACCDYGIQCNALNIRDLFPLHNYENAIPFGANETQMWDSGYWWFAWDWRNGRMEYLNWLIDKYKKDKVNLRKIKT